MPVPSFVKNCPLFFEVLDEEIELILKNSVVETYSDGDFILWEKDQGSTLFFLLSGEATVTKSMMGKVSAISVLRKGDLFGEAALITDGNRNANIISRGECDVLVIDIRDIFDLFKSNTKVFSLLILNLARVLSRKLQDSHRQTIASVYNLLDDTTEKKAA